MTLTGACRSLWRYLDLNFLTCITLTTACPPLWQYSCRNLHTYITLTTACLLPVSQFILPPGQFAPQGAGQPRLACPPRGKLSKDILPPTLVIFTPGGQAVQVGLSCPPPNKSKKYIHVILLFFCIILMNSDPL